MSNFEPFNEKEAVRIYRRNLPHWRQEGATYFVTFRLADSIPQPILNQWKEERYLWFKARGVNGQFNDAVWQEGYEKIPVEERRSFEKHNEHRKQVYLDQGYGGLYFETVDSF